MRVVVAPDKFKGTATASDIAQAIAQVTIDAGHEPVVRPMADGGDGTLDALGGANRVAVVTGPLGQPVEAPWRLDRASAVIEMALASGLVLAGGAAANEPIEATTRGTGELIVTAISRGAKRIIVGLGGSATTDGGLGAVDAIATSARLAGVQVQAASDVTTRFVDAAHVFGPQKGATPAQVKFLRARLLGVAQRYQDDFGVDVREVEASGAAGGLGGGLLALGAELVSGFELVAEEVGLAEAVESADVVITGEGRLDPESFAGKVVGGVIGMCRQSTTPVLVVAGDIDPDLEPLPGWVTAVSLVGRFGAQAAMSDPAGLAAQVVAEWLLARTASS